MLVLGDESLRTALVQRAEGPAIVRWMYARGEDQLHHAALKVDLDGRRPGERLIVGLRDEPYVIFDSAYDGLSAALLEFTPPSGVFVVQTYLVFLGVEFPLNEDSYPYKLLRSGKDN